MEKREKAAFVDCGDALLDASRGASCLLLMMADLETLDDGLRSLAATVGERLADAADGFSVELRAFGELSEE